MQTATVVALQSWLVEVNWSPIQLKNWLVRINHADGEVQVTWSATAGGVHQIPAFVTSRLRQLGVHKQADVATELVLLFLLGMLCTLFSVEDSLSQTRRSIDRTTCVLVGRTFCAET